MLFKVICGPQQDLNIQSEGAADAGFEFQLDARQVRLRSLKDHVAALQQRANICHPQLGVEFPQISHADFVSSADIDAAQE